MTNWKETTLGEVAEFSNGRTSPERFDSGKYEVFGSNGIIGLSDETNSDANTIIIGRVGSYCGSLYFSKNKCWVTDNAIKANAEKNSDPLYLYYLLVTQKLNSKAVGSGQPLINQSILNSIEVKVPVLLDEQKAIAAILSSFDDKIELLRRQNKTLEKIAQTIFKEWFVSFTVEGKKLKINSKTGLPEGWRMGKLGDEFQIIMGQSPNGASYNESGEGMIFFQGRAEFQERFPTIRLYTTEPKRIAEKFDVLVSVRAPVGDINVASDKCCIGRGLAAVRGNYKSYVLYKIISLQDAFNKFEAEGTVFGSIGKDSFANIEAIIPDSETVKAFEVIANVIDGKIFNNNSQIQTLSKLRDTLLPKLMNGEIRVKGFNN